MNIFFIVIILLRLSLATAANFTQVFQWDELDYEWPSEEERTKALKDGTFKPANISLRYMAVYRTRIFLSINKWGVSGIPVSLVSLPTSNASSASPKLTPFPSWHMHQDGNCDKIEKARGLQVDGNGRLWVLDAGSNNCSAKIWTIDLTKNDHTKLIHRFSFQKLMHDLVLDETANETFAYITRWGENYIVVFSLEKKQSWNVSTPGIKVFSIALSLKEEPRQLYLGKFNSTELYSTSVAALRRGNRTANPELIGNWSAEPYRMLMDNHGTMYAIFWGKNYTSSWDTSHALQEQRFHEAGKQISNFALDSSGTFWITVYNHTGAKPRYRILKAAVNAKANISDSPTTDVSTLSSSTVKPDCKCDEGEQYDKKEGKKGESTYSALVGSLAFFLVLSCTITLWLSMRMRKLRNSNKQRDAGVVEMEIPTLQNPVSPEMVHEEIENDLYGVFPAPAPGPRL